MKNKTVELLDKFITDQQPNNTRNAPLAVEA
jgi:hypothetical protein